MQKIKLKTNNKKKISGLKEQLNSEKRMLNELIDEFEEKSSELKSCLTDNIDNQKFFDLKNTILSLNEKIIEKKKTIVSIEDKIKISYL